MENQNQTSFISKLLTIMIIITLSICIFVVISIELPDAHGKNIKYYSADDANVYFYPVCPECNHKNQLDYVNISKGEEYSGYETCSECYYSYEITVER